MRRIYKRRLVIAGFIISARRQTQCSLYNIGFVSGRWRDLWPRLRTAVVRWDWGTKDPLQEIMPGQGALACWDRKKMRIVITGKYFKHA